MPPPAEAAENAAAITSNRVVIPSILTDFPRLVGQHATDTQRFLVKRLIGRGSFACVYLMVDRAFQNRIVVGKHMVTSHMTEKNRAFAFSEAQNASKFNVHPNVVHFYGSYLSTEWQGEEDPNHSNNHHVTPNNVATPSSALSSSPADSPPPPPLTAASPPDSPPPNPHPIVSSETTPASANLLLVFEFADAGDLSVQVNARAPNKYFRDHEVLMIIAQIAMALHCLHRQHVIHRDLKTANVFLTSSGLMKLGDFGLSKEYDATVSMNIGNTFCGTPYYVAPELWNRQRYSNKADVWSLGVVMYELMALRRPFQGADMKMLVKSICNGQPEPLLPECAAMYSSATKQLMYAMLAVNPLNRPSVGEIMRTPVMQELGLRQLQVNVPRLGGIPQEVRDALLEDVEHYLASGAVASPLGDTAKQTLVEDPSSPNVNRA